MATRIVVPQLGNEITEAEVTEFHVAVGDTVVEGDAVATITTTKMAVEIETPENGEIASIDVEEGSIVKIGTTLCTLS